MKHNFENQYLDILGELVDYGVLKENRTGTNTYALFDRSIRHDMSLGFPALTTKRIAFKTLKVELEGFIKGITSKGWYQERGCHIWDEWCNPQKVPYGTDEETKAKMLAEDDLGPCIYGASWRGFHDPQVELSWGIDESGKELLIDNGESVDQFKNIVDTLKTNPDDRRMVCLAWNPLGLKHTALPACHLCFIVNALGGKLNLTWLQRSADWFLGVPLNAAFYGMLLHLLAKEAGLEEGELVGHFVDVHLYDNHIDQAKIQLERHIDKTTPQLETESGGIFDWDHTKSSLFNYKPQPSIKAPVAV
jgi:thymidylate synthase